MKSKQTTHSSKEILYFRVMRNHDQLVSSMRKYAPIIVVLMILSSFNVEATEETTTAFTTDTIYQDVPEEISTDVPSTVIKEEDSNKSTNLSISRNHSMLSSNVEKFQNVSTSKSPKDEFRNVKITAFYDDTLKKILLNISWDKTSDWSDANFYKFNITSTSTYSGCKTRSYSNNINYDNFVWRESNMKSPNIYLPPLYNHAYDINPGCTYKITLEKRGYPNTVQSYITIPQCMAIKCSCEYRTPRLSTINVQQVPPNKMNISWVIDYNPVNTTANNITKINFGYRSGSQGPFALLHTLSNFSSGKNYLIPNHTFASKQYQLEATFTNMHECIFRNYTNFTINPPKPDDIKQRSNFRKSHSYSSNFKEIALLIVILSFALLTVAYFLRRNRLVLKELILNPFALRFTRQDRHRQDLRTSYVMIPTISKRQQEANILYVDKEIIDGNVDQYEFPRSRLKEMEEIGEGAFGQVFKAKAYGINGQPGYTYVAIKKLRERAPPEEMDDFLSEIDILKKVGEHPNIITIYACCILQEPYLMIMEFVPCGDLKHYLLDLREKWIKKKRSRNDSTPVFSDASDGAYITPDSPRSRLTSDGRPSVTETEYTTLDSEGFPTPTERYNSRVEPTLDHTELQNFALQIARGMEHLEKIPIAHRDLAARNILINEFKTLKISDFGLSRIGPYVNTKKKKLPLRWMSIESIQDNFYDSKSDVWSFAIVLWEIGTLGAFPYENVLDVMVPHYLTSGKRLPRPEICTDELYSLMLKCWSHSPDDRPSFQELVELLDVKRRRIYVDFNQLNPLYVFPPSERDKKLSSSAGDPSV